MPVGRLTLEDIRRALSTEAQKIHVIDVRLGTRNLSVIGLIEEEDEYTLDVIYVPKGDKETLKSRFVDALSKGRLLKLSINRTSNQAEILSYDYGIDVKNLVEMIENEDRISVPTSYYLTVVGIKFAKTGGTLSGVLDVDGISIPLTVSGLTFVSSVVDSKVRHGEEVEGKFIAVITLRKGALAKGITSIKKEYFLDPEKRDYLAIYALLPVLGDKSENSNINANNSKREQKIEHKESSESSSSAIGKEESGKSSSTEGELTSTDEDFIKRQLMEFMKLVKEG